jgi:hypothetical protein
MTVVMKIDLVGPQGRGLAVGLNEFAGYLAVGATAFLTGYLASVYGLRPEPFYLGIAYVVLGILVSVFLVRDTREHVRLEMEEHPPEPNPLGFGEVFAKTTYGDRNLFAASQAGLVNNLNDGMSWGVFPLFFSGFGLGVERIGILKAVYPAVWGTLQVATGPLSDRWGRKGLIVSGMWVQAGGALRHRVGQELRVVDAGEHPPRFRHGDGLPIPHRGRLRRVPPVLESAVVERLPLLARPWLRGGRPLSRDRRRRLRALLGHRLGRGADLLLGRDRRRIDARERQIVNKSKQE